MEEMDDKNGATGHSLIVLEQENIWNRWRKKFLLSWMPSPQQES